MDNKKQLSLKILVQKSQTKIMLKYLMNDWIIFKA